MICVGRFSAGLLALTLSCGTQQYVGSRILTKFDASLESQHRSEYRGSSVFEGRISQNSSSGAGFEFQCGGVDKKADAECQGCWGVVVAMIQAQRPKCMQDGSGTALFDTFIDSIALAKTEGDKYKIFCEAIMGSKQVGVAHCRNYLYNGYKGFPPGAMGIDDMIKTVGTQTGLRGINDHCNKPTDFSGVPAHQVGDKCNCNVWPKLLRAVDGGQAPATAGGYAFPQWIADTAKKAYTKSCTEAALTMAAKPRGIPPNDISGPQVASGANHTTPESKIALPLPLNRIRLEAAAELLAS